MNKIQAEYTKTAYDYEELYWLIDGKAVVYYLDEAVKSGKCPELGPFGSLQGLLPAWTGELARKAENQFIWELIDDPDTLNVPILVCEDDCDLSCIVILARIHKDEDTVCWEKLGLLCHENEDAKQEQQSGIMNFEAYTEEDWEKYGDNIACEPYGSPEFLQWVSDHWDEELLRRKRSYTKPYMQKDDNMIWITEPRWTFERGEYDRMVETYRKVYADRMESVKRAALPRSTQKE